VPFARHRSGFTCDFEALVAWLATRTDQTTITRLVRIDWDTVGGIIARVSADQLDRDRLENLFEIGIEGEAGLETVDHVPTGGRVTIACRGRGCPFSRKTFRRARSVTLTRYFAGAHLLPGATVDVRITAPNSVGKDALLTTRSGAGPTEVDLCLPPGARKPLKCAS
jgi:hypothetical protein